MRSVWDTPLGQARLKELQEAADKERDAAQRRTVRRISSGFQQRMYASAQSSRLTSGWSTSNSSADSELVTSLTTLRSRARALVRDASYAKRARTLVINNVIGNGIGVQAQVMTTRDQLNDRVNDEIEDAWAEWAEASSCHTGGRLHFSHFERALMGQVFEAGEVLIRKHYRPFGRSRVPFALELIEAERLADEFQSPYLAAVNGNEVRMGVEVDRFGRPVAYFIRERHLSEHRFGGGQLDRLERVPADQILHLAVVDRWPQTRGEPWLHAVARRLMDMDGYSEAEIIRARSQAGHVGVIKTPEESTSFGDEQDDGSVEMEVTPGVFKRTNPGEDVTFMAPTAPNAAMEPFMRYMVREFGAGIGISYAPISGDYAQANYSSERAARLDDRDTWRFYQSWFIRDCRHLIHREWLQQAVFSRAITSIGVEQYAMEPRKFEAVRFKPRGWAWVDPTVEVEAYTQAVKSGFTTVSDVIAQTAGGADIEDIMDTREQELALMNDKGLVFETSPEIYQAESLKTKAEAKAAARPPPDTPQGDNTTDPKPAPSRLFSVPRKL